MRLGVVACGRQQPAAHEFADGRCSAGETILESELVDRRQFFRRQHELKTLGALTFACALSQSLSHTEDLSLETSDFQARKFTRARRNHNSTTIVLSNLPAEISRVAPMTSAGAHLQRRYRVPAGLPI